MQIERLIPFWGIGKRYSRPVKYGYSWLVMGKGIKKPRQLSGLLDDLFTACAYFLFQIGPLVVAEGRVFNA